MLSHRVIKIRHKKPYYIAPFGIFSVPVTVSIFSVPVTVSIDTESIPKGAVKVNSKNSVIIGRKEKGNIILAIFNIFDGVDFNDNLESFELLSKYILSQKRKKHKRKKP